MQAVLRACIFVLSIGRVAAGEAPAAAAGGPDASHVYIGASAAGDVVVTPATGGTVFVNGTDLLQTLMTMAPKAPCREGREPRA